MPRSSTPRRSLVNAGAIATIGSLALTLAIAPAASAATYTVAWDGTGDYTTIQAAVDAAASGDTITVKAGTYAEDVTISTELTLVGEGSATTTISGLILADAPIDVSDFTLSYGGGSEDRIVRLTVGADGSTFTDNVFDGLGTAAQGLFIDSVTGDTTTVDGNTFTGMDDGDYGALWLYKSSDIDVTDNTFSSAADGVGVNIGQGTSDVTISGNSFSSVSNALVLIALGSSASTGVSFTDNTVSDTSSSALYIGGNNVTDLTIARNSFTDVAANAVLFTAGYSGNPTAWIEPSGADLSAIAITDNDFISADTGIYVGDGVVMAGDGAITSTGNTFRTMASGYGIASASSAGAIVSDGDDFTYTAGVSGDVLVSNPANEVGSEPSATPAPTTSPTADTADDAADELAETGVSFDGRTGAMLGASLAIIVVGIAVLRVARRRAGLRV